MGRLDGKVAIVTGAGQGIGRGVALVLAKEGAAVVVAELNPDSSAATAQEIEGLGGQSLAVVCDVRRRDEVNAAVARTVEQFGTVDILVNCAMSYSGLLVPFEETSDEAMALCHETGTLGTLYFMQACFPHMKLHRGKIVNFGSAAGTEGMAGLTAYAAAKEAIRTLTRVAAKEWGRYAINVNAVCPSADSPAKLEYYERYPEEAKIAAAAIPLGRRGDCERDIGPAVLALVSNDMDYVTGMTLMVDGGRYVLR